MATRNRRLPSRVPSLSEKADGYVRCYTLGHAWDNWPQDDWTPNWKSLVYRPVSFRCESCGTVRREYLNRENGELSANPGRRYIYPEGFLLGRLDLAELGMTRRELARVEYLDRLPE